MVYLFVPKPCFAGLCNAHQSKECVKVQVDLLQKIQRRSFKGPFKAKNMTAVNFGCVGCWLTSRTCNDAVYLEISPILSKTQSTGLHFGTNYSKKKNISRA